MTNVLPRHIWPFAFQVAKHDDDEAGDVVVSFSRPNALMQVVDVPESGAMGSLEVSSA